MIMSRYMSQELIAFTGAFFQGAVLLMIYDTLTVWKIVRRSGRFASDFRDLLFWIFSALYTFRGFYQATGGSLRGYLFAGMLLGVLAWKYSLGPYYRRFGMKILNILGKVFGIPIRILKKLRKRLKFHTEKGKIKIISILRPEGRGEKKPEGARKKGTEQ